MRYLFLLLIVFVASCEKDPIDETFEIPTPIVNEETKDEADTLSEWSDWTPEFNFQAEMERRFTNNGTNSWDGTHEEFIQHLGAPFVQTRTREIIVNGAIDDTPPSGVLSETRSLQITTEVETTVTVESELNPATDINQDGDLIDEVTYDTTTFSYLDEVYRIGGGITIKTDLTEVKYAGTISGDYGNKSFNWVTLRNQELPYLVKGKVIGEIWTNTGVTWELSDDADLSDLDVTVRCGYGGDSWANYRDLPLTIKGKSSQYDMVVKSIGTHMSSVVFIDIDSGREIKSPEIYVSSGGFENLTIPASIGCNGYVTEERNGNYYPVCNAIYVTIAWYEDLQWTADVVEQIDGTNSQNSFAKISPDNGEIDWEYDQYCGLHYQSFILTVDDNKGGYGRVFRITFSSNTGIQKTVTFMQAAG